MKKTLIFAICVLCLVLCACTPQSNSENPDTTPAPTDPKPTPGLTIIAPSGTPGEYIVPADPSDVPVYVPIESVEPSPELTPAPTPEDKPVDTPVPTTEDTPVNTPADSPDATPAPTPEETQKSTNSGIDLPYIPWPPK